eukprot:364964-Chlamydomonas_euryale.AAC.15
MRRIHSGHCSHSALELIAQRKTSVQRQHGARTCRPGRNAAVSLRLCASALRPLRGYRPR